MITYETESELRRILTARRWDQRDVHSAVSYANRVRAENITDALNAADIWRADHEDAGVVERVVPDLAALLDWMRENPNADWTDLPTFGGPDIHDTDCVWSWDENSVLVGEGKGDLEILRRDSADAW